MIPLFSHPVYRRYLAPRCSLAYLFSWVCSIIVVLIPFILSFTPEHMRGESTEGGLWIKHKSYREQAQIHFRQDLILVVQAKERIGVNSTTTSSSDMRNEWIDRPKEIFFSTSSYLNQLYPNTFRMASIQSREIDRNLDNVIDSINIQVSMPLHAGEYVYSIQLVSGFDYSLSHHVKIQMDTLAFLHYTSGLPFTTLISKGELKSKQRALFPIRKSTTVLYKDDALFPASCDTVKYMSTIQQLLEKADSRLFSTDYLERYTSANRADHVNKAGLISPVLNITLTLHNNVQTIDYTPAMYELLTDAWIRYFSLYWIAMKLMRQMYSFVYPNQLIETFEKIDRTHTHWSKKHN